MPRPSPPRRPSVSFFLSLSLCLSLFFRAAAGQPGVASGMTTGLLDWTGGHAGSLKVKQSKAKHPGRSRMTLGAMRQVTTYYQGTFYSRAARADWVGRSASEAYLPTYVPVE